MIKESSSFSRMATNKYKGNNVTRKSLVDTKSSGWKFVEKQDIYIIQGVYPQITY